MDAAGAVEIDVDSSNDKTLRIIIFQCERSSPLKFGIAHTHEWSKHINSCTKWWLQRQPSRQLRSREFVCRMKYCISWIRLWHGEYVPSLSFVNISKL